MAIKMHEISLKIHAKISHIILIINELYTALSINRYIKLYDTYYITELHNKIYHKVL
jgi:hypothetical protein